MLHGDRVDYDHLPPTFHVTSTTCHSSSTAHWSPRTSPTCTTLTPPSFPNPHFAMATRSARLPTLPILLFSVFLLLSLPLSLLAQSPTSWSSVTIQSATSPNCTQSGVQVLSCPFPTYLILTTSGYGNLLSLTNAATVAIITAPDGTEAVAQLSRYVGDNGSNTTLQGNVLPTQYDASFVASSTSATAPLCNISIRAMGGGPMNQLGATAAVTLISFAYDAGPSLTSISGCTGSGVSTTACDPAVAVLTFQGSGFRWFSNPGQVQLWIGTSYTTVTGPAGGPNQAALTVQSDSMMTVALSTAYVYLLLPSHYGGASVPIFFNEPRNAFGTQINSYTNQLSVSFIPQPAATISNVFAGGGGGGNQCQGTNGTGPYTACVPLVSYLNIVGSYMYDINVTVGGVACAQLVQQNSNLVRCLLPQLTGTGPYDMVVSDQNAAVVVYTTESGLISFVSGPSVASVTTCTNTGATNNQGFFFGGLCTENAPITISGTNFVVGDGSLVVTATQGNGANAVSVNCLSPVALTSTMITCTLPYLASQTPPALSLYGAQVSLRAYFNNAATQTNALSLQLYNYYSAPQVTNLNSQGQNCQYAPGLLEYNCGSGAQLTLTGANLWNGTNVQVVPVAGGPQSWSCSVQSYSATRIVCTLPTFDAQVSPVSINTLYAMVLCVQQPNGGPGGNNGGPGNGGPNGACSAVMGPGNWVPSNAFYVSFNLGTGISSWSQVSIVSVTSPNCTMSGSMLTNCVLPTQLMITTSGYGALLNPQQAELIVVAPDGTELGYGFGGTSGTQMGRASYDNGANVYLTATIYPSQYTPSIMGSSAAAAAPVCNLTIEGFYNGQTAGAPLISFAYDSPPSLTSISGCTGSGAATTACDPATAVLTFTGSGFRWYSNAGAVQVWMGSSYATVNGGQGGGGNQPSLSVQSDSMMTLNLATAYVYVLLPVHYGGAQVPIFFNEYKFTGGQYVSSYTNQLQVSFIPQPAPVIVSTTIGPMSACQGTNGTGPYTNCVPQVSYIQIAGRYIYDVSVTVGGQPCASVVTVSAQLLRCVLPLLSGTGPFDLVVSDPNAATTAYATASGLVSYRSGPTISSVTTCTTTGQTNWLGFFFGGICSEGSVITVTGTNFPPSDPTLVVNMTWTPNGPTWQRPAYGQVPISVQCVNPTILSSTTISCTLPYLSQQTGAAINASLVMYYANLQLQLSFSSGSTMTNSLQVQMFNYPTPPTVTQVSGCGLTNSALSVSNCAAGYTLTITGSNLYNGSWIQVQPVTQGFAAWSCLPLTYSASQITCQLPSFDPQVSPVASGTTYIMQVNVEQAGQGFLLEPSNAFYIDFGGVVSPSSSSSKSLSTGAIVAIAVIVPIAALVLLALVVFGCRRGGAGLPSMKMSKGTGFGKHVDESNGGDSAATDVEIA